MLNKVDKRCMQSYITKTEPVMNDRLQVAVFDDANETHSVYLPFVGINKGTAIYKEPADCLDLPKEVMWQMGKTQVCWKYAAYPEALIRAIRLVAAFKAAIPGCLFGERLPL